MSTYSLKLVGKALLGTNFYTDRARYAFLKLAKADYPAVLAQLANFPPEYSEIINDKDELSLIIASATWEKSFAHRFKPLASMGEVALITCEVKQETVTGYLLAIIAMLPPHNISVFVQSAYTTDHIFVKYDQLDETLALLNQLKS